MTTAAASVPVSPIARPAGARDRLFYGSMSIVMALTVVAGFGRTYYSRWLAGGPMATLSGGPFTPLVHLHGALFTSWIVLFIVQTALISSRRVAVHRRLGVAGAVLAAAMIVVGITTAIATAARGSAPPGIAPLVFLVVPLFDMTLFAIFITAALVLRRDKEAHKRLMLLAYVNLIVAAVARLPGMLLMGPPAFFAGALLFLVAGMIYDVVSRGRVHRTYLWGGALIVISVPLRLAISGTAAWHAFAEMLTR